MEGSLWINDLEEKIMIAVNGHCLKKKGDSIYAERKIRSFIGRKNPEFDNLTSVTPSLKSYVSCFSAIVQRFIGRHRLLWPIIKMLDKKNN